MHSKLFSGHHSKFVLSVTFSYSINITTVIYLLPNIYFRTTFCCFTNDKRIVCKTDCNDDGQENQFFLGTSSDLETLDVAGGCRFKSFELDYRQKWKNFDLSPCWCAKMVDSRTWITCCNTGLSPNGFSAVIIFITFSYWQNFSFGVSLCIL